MAKINITKVTGGIESLNLISAFKSDGTTKVVFDSEKIGSMGLPIIYISKYTDKLEKIVNDNEWQNVKNNLKGIINGTNFEYVTIPENVSSDDVYYTPLTLPAVSFDAIKNNYKVPVANSVISPNLAPTEPLMPNNNVVSNIPENVTPIEEVPTINPIPNIPPIEQVTPATPAMENIAPVSPSIPPISTINSTREFVAPTAPGMPTATPTIEPLVSATPAPTVSEPKVEPPIETIMPNVTEVKATPSFTPSNLSIDKAPVMDELINLPSINFDNDKETFLKACENMFDALIAKYQKELMELEKREQALALKEQEIKNKMHDANEALANAEAREQVANIAHDNAQKVMDFSSIMPHPVAPQGTTF